MPDARREATYLMTKDEERKRRECWKSDCKYFELYCLIYHGEECIRLSGRKIPVMRTLYHEPRQPRESVKSGSWKHAYFMADTGRGCDGA